MLFGVESGVDSILGGFRPAIFSGQAERYRQGFD